MDSAQAEQRAERNTEPWVGYIVQKEGWMHFGVNLPIQTIKSANEYTYQIIH